MLSLILVLIMGGNAQAQRSGHATNTNIYEQEKEPESTQSFSAKVRVVREISEEVEVFFEGDKQKGAYTLPHSLQSFGTLLKVLEKSKKDGSPVTVVADSEKRIKSVVAQAKPEGYQIPKDPNESWDFEKAVEMMKGK